MSVSSTDNQVIYTGSGTTGPFDFDFKCFVSSDLLVQKLTIATEAIVDLTETTDYSVTIDEDGTGHIDTVVAVTSAYKLIITRQLPLTQEVSYVENDKFPSSSHEEALDRAAMRDQQLQEQIDRCVKSSPGVAVPTIESINAAVSAAQAAQTAAELAETNAETAEANAEAYQQGLTATSTTSLAIEVASKTFTIQASKAFEAGQYILAVDNGNSANWMFGQVTSYSGTSLVMDSQVIGGSGTIADWTISVSGIRGATGPQGSVGSGAILGTFTNATLSSGILTITHNLALTAPYSINVLIFDNENKQVMPKEVTGAANSVAVDLTPYGTITGTWGYSYGIVSGAASGVLGDGSVNPTNLLPNGDFESWSAGASAAADGWTLIPGRTSAIAREASIVKLGAYSAKLTRATTDALFGSTILSTSVTLAYIKGRTITFGCWVYATVANRACLSISDGNSQYLSSYHTGDSTWQWLSKTITVDSGALGVTAYCAVNNGDTSAYFDGAICVEGNSAFAFYPKPAEDGVWTQYVGTTISGWANPVGAKVYTKRIGKTCFFEITIPASTSDAITASVTLPYTSVNTSGTSGMRFPCFVQNNGANSATPGYGYMNPNSTLMNFYRDWDGTNWTASGNKSVACCGWYECA